jgi:NADPH-dependent glutamate synthase beta subunit-like oxidoreductase
MTRSKHGARHPAEDLPPASISSSDMSWNRTGSWRYLIPRFVRRGSPCQEACPAGTDISGSLLMAAEGRYREALQRILLDNPFPGVCGRVCYHPCEAACNRIDLDAPVAVQAIERFVAEAASGFQPAPSAPPRPERVAVVGSGPSGLTCAYHLALLGYRVTVFEQAIEPGGMLRLGIPAYRLPRNVLDCEIRRILDLGVEARTGCRVGRDVPWDALYEWDAVYLGIGAWRSGRLNVPGEDLPGVMPGLRFLREVNAGRSVSVGRRMAVIGGGNTALDCARVALRLGSEPVILYRRRREEMPADEAEVAEALDEGVSFEWLSSPVAIRASGKSGLTLEAVRHRPGHAGRSGRPAPIPGSNFILTVDGVLTAVGEMVEADDLPAGLAAASAGVGIDAWGRTALARTWAGGDVTSDPRMVVHAVGAGKRAALCIHADLNGEDPDALSNALRIGDTGAFSMSRYVERGSQTATRRDVVRWSDLNPDHLQPQPRTPLRPKTAALRAKDFAEVNPGYSEAEARQEAERCVHCGLCDRCGNCYWFCPDLCVTLEDGSAGPRVDERYCKGCGICAQECPRAAVVMEEDS